GQQLHIWYRLTRWTVDQRLGDSGLVHVLSSRQTSYPGFSGQPHDPDALEPRRLATVFVAPDRRVISVWFWSDLRDPPAQRRDGSSDAPWRFSFGSGAGRNPRCADSAVCRCRAGSDAGRLWVLADDDYSEPLQHSSALTFVTRRALLREPLVHPLENGRGG